MNLYMNGLRGAHFASKQVFTFNNANRKRYRFEKPGNRSVFVDKAVKHNISVTGRAIEKENRVAKMLLGSLFVRTFDSYCSYCCNDCRKSLGGRYNGKIHHR